MQHFLAITVMLLALSGCTAAGKGTGFIVRSVIEVVSPEPVSRCPDYLNSSAAMGDWGGHWLASGDLSGISYSPDQWNLLINGKYVEGCFESTSAYMGKFKTTISNSGRIGADIYASGSYIRLDCVMPVLTISDGKGRKSTLTFHGGN